jgi:hypothetical protein
MTVLEILTSLGSEANIIYTAAQAVTALNAGVPGTLLTGTMKGYVYP